MMKLEDKIKNPAKGKEKQLEEGYKLNEAGLVVPDYDQTIKFFDEGDVVKGTVVRIDRDEVLIDVGYKSEGVIPLKELSIKSNTNPNEIIEVGQEIETLVLQKEDSDGRLILSKKRADFEKAWNRIEEAYRTSEQIKGTVIEVVRGGLILDVGVRGFLPASLVDLNRVKELNQFIGQELDCKIIEMNRHRNNVVLSRRAVLEGEKKTEKKELITKLERGQLVTGKISSIVDFGAFVDLGGIDGLIHISELSWSHINHPSEVVHVGDEVKVQVLEIDTKKARVSLGYKQTQEDSWKKTVEKYNIGDIYEAKAIRCLPFGVFVEFGEGLEGLIHISELSHRPVNDPRKFLNVGDELKVKLLSIDLERRRISLSLKQTKEQTADSGQQTVERVEEKETTSVAEEQEAVESKEEIKEEQPEAKETTKEKAEPAAKVKEQATEEIAPEAKEQAIEEETGQKEQTVDRVESQESREGEVGTGFTPVREEGKKEITEQEQMLEKEKPTKEEQAADTEEQTVEEKTEEKETTSPAEEQAVEEKQQVAEEKTKTKEEELLEKLSDGEKEETKEQEEELPEPSSLEDVLEQMKKSHGSKK